VFYWRRDNGEYIVFNKRGEQYVAEYGAYDFVLYHSEPLRGWVLRYYYRTGPSTGNGGQCGFFEELPGKEELKNEVEAFLFVMDRLP